MSKVQYVGDKHMASCKCVTSFRRKAAILFSKERGKQRSSINDVFGTERLYKERNTSKSRKRILRQ